MPSEDGARAGVRAALEGCLARGELGIQVAVYRRGELILDETIGMSSPGCPADPGTLFPIFSVTKILPIMAVHLQAERGLVDYDTPVAAYWPQYAANGKEAITVRHVLSHRAGVPTMPEGVTIDTIGDWDWMTARLAELAPVWPTNTRSSYLSYTYGWILGEVVRRTDPGHRSFRQFLIDELFTPLGIVDLYLGIPDDDAVEDRIATLSAPSFKPASDQAAPFRRLAIPPGLAPGAVFNDPRLRRAVFPSAGAITNARSVARLMAVIANRGELDGVRLYSPERVDSFLALREDPYAVDEVIGKAAIMSWSGFRMGSDHPNREPIIGTSPHVLSQSGAGGSVAWADTGERFSAAICHNRMLRPDSDRPDEHTFHGLGEAVRALIRSFEAADLT
jgi:CubicO group peptidase (beta-lactamase class C family)